MSGALTPARLLPQLSEWLRSRGGSGVFVVHQDGEWTGRDSVLVDNEHTVSVRVCPSELALREELARPRAAGQPLVLLYPGEEVASDVAARLASSRVLRLNAWAAVRQLFDVRIIDPALLTQDWMARALVEAAPAQGYERTGARGLDAERAWNALLVHRHHLDPDDGLVGLLDWAAEGRGSRLAQLGDEERDATIAHLSARIEGSPPVLATATAPAGLSDRVVALGLVARVLADGPASDARVAGRALLGSMLDGWAFDERSARSWADAAEARVGVWLHDDDARARRTLQAADRALAELQAEPLAATSDLLTQALRQRAEAFARALAAWRVGEATAGEVELAGAPVREHRLDDYRLAVVMASRLVRWCSQPTAAEPRDLPAAAARHIADGAYADWARIGLRAVTGVAVLDDELRALMARAAERRRCEEGSYAQALASWTSHAPADSPVVGVEEVLDRVVAPLALDRPLLLLVLDGMAHRVACELMVDLTQRGWLELKPEGATMRLPVLSVLPSVTTLSRTSLLSGRLAAGVLSDEQAAFGAHPALVAASGRSGQPRLFHKGALSDSHGGLSSDVRDVVLGPQRVVGVVINAIDDHLARNDQIATDWNLRNMPLVAALMDAARDAAPERLVILASDHGHVLEHEGAMHLAGAGAGERWRPANTPATDGEVLVEGPRVLKGDGRCVLAWDERVRYASRKHGYHGGASAQETLAPLIVLTPGTQDPPTGWVEASDSTPAWWDASRPAEEAVTEPSASARPRAPGAVTAGQLSIDTPRPDTAVAKPAGAPSWLPALLRSDTMVAQRGLAGRAPVSDDRIGAVLAPLVARGGRMPLDALAREAGIPLRRARSTVAALRALLNVDGYAVIELDDAVGQVVLDVRLLGTQFGIEVG